MDSVSINRALASIIAASIGWVIYIVTDRLLLSPLSTVPGPKLAALTHWYEFYYDVLRPGQYVFKIKQLHARYGPIIRITPREVHIKDVEFLEEIYPASNSRKREKDVFQLRNLALPYATAGAQGHELHRRRREALNPFFSQKSVFALEPLIARKVSQMCGYLDAAMQRPGEAVVNLYDLYYALARDIVFEYSFDRDCNVLGDIGQAAVMRRNLTEMLLMVKLKANLPLLFKLLNSLPAGVGKYFTPRGAGNMLDLRKSISSEISEIMARKTQDLQKRKRSILYDLGDRDELQKPEELPARLGQEGTFLVMAATESTAKTLGITHFHLLRNRLVLSSLREELSTAGPRPSLTKLSQLPFLNAVISEGNRLAFGLTGRVARVAPEETLRYGSHAIPPGTPMSMTTLCIHTDEKVFPQPWEFRPERWLGEEGKQRQKYHYGFGRGARRCLGMNLANAELLVCISAIAAYDMELFETDLIDVEFQHDFQVAHPRLDSKGIRAVVLKRGSTT